MISRFSIASILLGLSVFGSSAFANPDLIAAAKEGDRDAVLNALEAGRDGPASLGRPLFFAAQRGHAEVVRLLLEHGADPNTSFTFGSPLHTAARANDTAVVALILEHGGDPNLPAGDFDQSPLHEAADRGATEVVRILIAGGADVNFRNDKGQPAIHDAAASGHQNVVELLRGFGAKPDLPNPIAPGELENANIEAGSRALNGCNTCHEVAEGKAATGIHVGPTLIGVFDAPRAGQEGYAYSDAMAALSGSWTAEALNEFLSDPTGVVPGTEMLRTPDMTREERIGIIAILRDAAR
ncbi:ankyrin repeat domain-containing protein [Psychromarinibacter halotolerans]